MSMVSFWTPVKYDIDSTTRWQRAREWVDEYFNLGCEVAVIWEKELNGVEPAKSQPGERVRWQTALKAASYIAFLFFRAANHSFPRLPLIPGVVVVQTVISCLPIAMVVIKAVLRFKSHFYLYAKEQSDSIPMQIKTTLDELLGGYGSVDRLPSYSNKEIPSPDEMTDPMMKGIREEKSNYPVIAIRMRRTSDGEMRVVAFSQRTRASLLSWEQISNSPQFFNKMLTVSNGTLSPSQVENFKRLQTLIQNGKGTDLNDVEWEIVGHQKNKGNNS